jgi:hypothetical protein
MTESTFAILAKVYRIFNVKRTKLWFFLLPEMPEIYVKSELLLIKEEIS